MRKLLWIVVLYGLFDYLIGGYCGGIFPLATGQAATTQILSSGGIGVSCNAVTTATSNNPGTAGGCTSFALVTSGGSIPTIFTWQVLTTGSPTNVTVNFMGSLDGTTWTQADTTSSASTRTINAVAYRFVGCVPTVLSGGSSPTVTCQISPSGNNGGSSGASSTLPAGTKGQPLVNSTGGATYATSGVYVDVTAFLSGTNDVSTGTVPCVQALTSLGGTCDARGVAVAASGQTQTQAIMPTSGIPTAGTLLLPVGWIRQVNALVCPNHWHCVLSGPHQVVTGGNATGGTVLGVGAAYRIGCGTTAGLSACGGGNASFSGTTLTLTNSVLASADIGTVVYMPAGGGAGSTAVRITAVTNGTTATCVVLGGAATQSGVSYSQRNAVAWLGDQPGSSPGFAVSIEGGVIDPGGLAGVAGIINMTSQEQSYVKGVSFTDYIDVALILDSSGAQNSGPYDLMTFNMGPQAGGACNTNSMDIIARVLGANRIVISNSTFTHTNCTSGAVQIGVEDEALGLTMNNDHFEGCTGCATSIQAVGVALAITCPVGCLSGPLNGHGSLFNGLNASGLNGLTMINVGTTTVQQSLTFLNLNIGATWTNILQDPNNSCAIFGTGSAGSVGQYFTNVDGSGGYSSSNGSFMGSISTATLGAGGSGYAANDTGTVLYGGTAATYTVNTVSSGAVSTFTISTAGTGYQVQNGYPTKVGGGQPGVGTGFTINVTAITAIAGCTENYVAANATSLTNGPGAAINIGGGRSTGTGLGGYVRLQTVIPSTTSGTTLNASMGRVTIAGHATASPTSASAITIGQFGTGTGAGNDFITNTSAHGEIIFGVTLLNAGTAVCTLTGVQPYAIENLGGTVVTNVGTQTATATACTAGNTFNSVTFALSAAHPSVLTYTPTWTTIAPTIARISYEVHDFGEADYVPQ